jgi:phage/plasmid-like protein (TIGR03299 family)
MSHNVTQGSYADRKPWFGLIDGVDVQDTDGKGMTREAIIAAGTHAFTVERHPSTVHIGDTILNTGDDALVRYENGKPIRVLGNVSPRYHILQPEFLFEWMEALQDASSDQLSYETAVELEGGKRIFLVARLHSDVKVAGIESPTMYLLSMNSFDGSLAFRTLVTPVRAECENMLRMAISGAPREWAAKHRKGAIDRMSEARESLGLSFTYVKAWESMANTLVATEFTQKDFGAMLKVIAPLPKDADPDSRKMKSAEANLDSMMGLFLNADNLNNVRGTAWAALNAVGEWHDWYRRTNGKSDTKLTDQEVERIKMEGQFKKNVLDTDIKDAALNYIVKSKKIVVTV